MQIYLQSKIFIKTIFLVVVFFAAVISIVSLYPKNGLQIAEKPLFNAQHSKYLSQGEKNNYKFFSNSEASAVSVDTKMNNDAEINAKSQIQSEKDKMPGMTPKENTPTTPSDVSRFCPDGNIDVYLHENGECVTMALEDYIVGCVCAEMPSSFASQALMAQSVAARTFAVRKMNFEDKTAHNGADVCTDYRHCQSYISESDYLSRGEYAKDALKKIRECTEATSGVVALFDNQPINAVYHASSAHFTKSSKEVWGGEVPYLVSVKAPEDMDLCSKTYTFSYDDLSQKIGAFVGQEVQCFSDNAPAISVFNNEYGSCTNIKISMQNLDSKDIKNILGLRSDDFCVTLTDDGAVFTTYGYGHLVGMSQYGADALAKSGYGYLDILKYYYNGINFGYLY